MPNYAMNLDATHPSEEMLLAPWPAGLPDHERSRIRAVQASGLMDTPPEPEFDELVEIAAAICGVTMGLFSLVDEHRLWVKAQLGIPIQECPRELSFCHHTIKQTGLLLVENAQRDLRFASNPFVHGEDGIRFYAGVPVRGPEGEALGSFCVMDHVPRTLNEVQQAALRTLARQVQARLELRTQRQALERALKETERARKEVAESEQRFSTFMNSGPFLAYLKDADGRMLFYNRQFAQEFGVSERELLGKTDAEVWPGEVASKARIHDLEALNSGESLVTEEEQIRDGDSVVSHWRSWKFRCQDADGGSLLGGISVDVTTEFKREAELQIAKRDLERANRQLLELATVDALTGLSNRRAFDTRVEDIFSQARRSGRPLCALLIDVDDFKQHNDRFGHAHGDDVLRALGKFLRERLRAEDMPARFGGEEFAILLPNTNEADALALAGRLLTTIRSMPWRTAPVTVSIGLSTLTPAMADTKRLMTLADEALYAAKRAGKNRVTSYSQVYRQTLASAQATLSMNYGSIPAPPGATQLALSTDEKRVPAEGTPF